ncbi:MAG: sigma-70 family RNA polymerase sigma factor [Fimbriimonadales bacterium]|nr:sigma-70 family RNA polymerase sigma factor [Fimbriimonadales bacterium]
MTSELPACLPSDLQRAVYRALRSTDTLCLPPCYNPTYWREERLQIAACAAWQAARSYDPNSGISRETYAALCAQRAIHAEWRRLHADNRLVQMPVDPETGEELEVEDPDACAAVWLQAECMQLRAALTTLNAIERQLLRWRFEDGLSEQEIAQRLGCSQPAICKRLQRILQRLRRFLEMGIAPNSPESGL